MDELLALLSRWYAHSVHKNLNGGGSLEPLFGQTKAALAKHGIRVVYDEAAGGVVRKCDDPEMQRRLREVLSATSHSAEGDS